MKFTFLVFLLLTSSAWARWSVATYNIRNFDSDPAAGKTDYQELENIITSVKSDVIAFQEVVNAEAFTTVLNRALPGYRYSLSTCGGRGKQKIAVAYDPAVFEFVSQKEDFSFSGGGQDSCGSLRPVFIVTLRMRATKENFVFAGIHLKAGGDLRSMQTRWGQYKKLEGLAGSLRDSQMIFLGDFNTTGYNIRNDDYTRFGDFLENAGLRTSAETTACTNYWTGADQNPDFLPSILDHIVMSNAQAGKIASTRVGAHCQKTKCAEASEADLGLSYAKVSDHCPVQVSFK
jgi:endonuclease/exonuclease/phosphatase family metal-dependent hydrolase